MRDGAGPGSLFSVIGKGKGLRGVREKERRLGKLQTAGHRTESSA